MLLYNMLMVTDFPMILVLLTPSISVCVRWAHVYGLIMAWLKNNSLGYGIY